MPENDDRPVTLASLRAQGIRSRGRRADEAGSASPKAAVSKINQDEQARAVSQMGLLFVDRAVRAKDLKAVEAPASGVRVPDAVAADAALGQSRVRVEPVPAVTPAADTTPWGRSGIGATRASGAVDVTETRASEKRVWTVRGIVADVRGRIEGGYGEVWVEGEISNCRPAASGHLYLTLKDGEAQLPVVLFRRQAQLLRFRPNTGMAVLVRGRLSVYEGRGELQLIAEVLEPRGAGALLVAFEQLKARLAAEGLFAAERKRALPPFPKCVGVITSISGAVLHDIVTVVRRRHGRLNLLVYPAAVQGAGCAASVVAGLRWFNRNAERVELILVARGGGSPEDLAGFNDEALARAIAASELPVISAVGHETDFTIADFVADLRAPTPSAAAEMMTERQHRIEERVEALDRRLRRASGYRLLEARQRFARMSADHVLRRVQAGLDRRQQRVDELERRMLRAVERAMAGRERRVQALQGRLERQNVATRLIWGRDRMGRLEDRLQAAVATALTRRGRSLERMAARLEALSPVAVLARGYALVYRMEDTNVGEAGEELGGLISSSAEISAGRRIRARLAQGWLTAEVTETGQE